MPRSCRPYVEAEPSASKSKGDVQVGTPEHGIGRYRYRNRFSDTSSGNALPASSYL